MSRNIFSGDREKMKRKMFLTVILTLATLSLGAAGIDSRRQLYYDTLKKYEDHCLPRPDKIPELKPESLQIDLARLKAMKDFTPLPLSREDYLRIAEYHRSDRAGKASWAAQTRKIAKWINEWKLPKNRMKNYVLSFLRIKEAVYVYFLSGNPVVGRFIHDHTMDAMTLGKWFWMGQTYTPDNLKKKIRCADLTAPHFANLFNSLLVRCPELFTPEERKILEDHYRENILYATYDDIQRRLKWNIRHNWLAILSQGMLISSRYFNDKEKFDLAAKVLLDYYRDQIEDDGSYGEGKQYLIYTLSAIPEFYPYLTAEQKEKLFESPYMKCAEWLWHQQIFDSEKFYIMNYGDDNFFQAAGYWAQQLYIPALAGDPFACDIIRKDPIFRRRIEFNERYEAVAHGRIPKNLPVPYDQLKKVRLFDCGELVIHTGWTEKDTHFAAIAHRPIKTKAHLRPESGSFCLARNGVPLVVSPGNSSLYYHPIHQFLTKTSSANTITLDNSNQIDGKKHQVRFTVPEEDEEKIISSCILNSAYAQKMKNLMRTFIFLKKSRTLVIVDKLEGAENDVLFRSHLHLNDLDHKSELKKLTGGFIRYTHPAAELYLWCSQPVSAERGYTVTAEDYAIRKQENYQKEAERGNNFALTIGPREKVKDSEIITVIAPEKPEIIRENGSFTVNGIQIPQ